MRLGSVLGSVIISGLVFGAVASCADEDNGVDEPDDTGGTGGVVIGTGGDGSGGDEQGSGGTNDGGAGETATGGNPYVPPPCEDWSAELVECGTNTQSADYRKPNIMLVVDKSGSMDLGFGSPESEPSRWEALDEALNAALEDVADDMNFGMILYPYNEDSSVEVTCEVPEGSAAVVVEMQEARTAVNAITGALRGTAPGGGTPTAEALRRAYEYFTNGDGASLVGEKYVLLATDGGPNCNSTLSCPEATCTVNMDGLCPSGNCCETATGAPRGEGCLDNDEVTDEIERLKIANIPTFVVGLPGTDIYYEYLDEFAVAGGRGKGSSPEYYAVSGDEGVTGLTQTFRDISTQLVKTCVLPLELAPSDMGKINVFIDCDPVPQYGDDTGWEIRLDPLEIEITGDDCDYILNEGAERVDVLYGCAPIL
ncbi:MAG: VWA domain-containing protein [Polyangiaceae bacterium]|nr:VWA domain-containing protein [Polyangiaceae bacterium]